METQNFQSFDLHIDLGQLDRVQNERSDVAVSAIQPNGVGELRHELDVGDNFGWSRNAKSASMTKEQPPPPDATYIALHHSLA